MLELIKKIVGKREDKKTVPVSAEEARVALCVLLLEAAHSDGECSEEEMEHVITTLIEHFGVLRSDVDAIIKSAHQERDDAVDLFRFTRYLNNNYSKEEKLRVMESVWRVIHTDGRLEAHEDHFAHKLANLLRLTHKELIDAKIAARLQLDQPC